MPRRVVGPIAGEHPTDRASPAGSRDDQPITVLVADERRAVAEALALALSREEGLRVEVAQSASEAVRMAARNGAAVVFLDLGMPGPGGIESIRRIREAAPAAIVIAMGAFDDDLLWARAIEAGAMGYVSRGTALDDLPRIVRRAARGGTLISPDDEARLFRLLRRQRHQDSTERQRVNRLTPRQLEILQLTADGMTPAQIAERLDMSPLTLRTHVQNILTRLGVHTKLEAVTVTMRHGKLKTDR
jgi:DNA-binding NarL/FixJ family response regulator